MHGFFSNPADQCFFVCATSISHSRILHFAIIPYLDISWCHDLVTMVNLKKYQKHHLTRVNCKKIASKKSHKWFDFVYILCSVRSIGKVTLSMWKHQFLVRKQRIIYTSLSQRAYTPNKRMSMYSTQSEDVLPQPEDLLHSARGCTPPTRAELPLWHSKIHWSDIVGQKSIGIHYIVGQKSIQKSIGLRDGCSEIHTEIHSEIHWAVHCCWKIHWRLRDGCAKIHTEIHWAQTLLSEIHTEIHTLLLKIHTEIHRAQQKLLAPYDNPPPLFLGVCWSQSPNKYHLLLSIRFGSIIFIFFYIPNYPI